MVNDLESLTTSVTSCVQKIPTTRKIKPIRAVESEDQPEPFACKTCAEIIPYKPAVWWGDNWWSREPCACERQAELEDEEKRVREDERKSFEQYREWTVKNTAQILPKRHARASSETVTIDQYNRNVYNILNKWVEKGHRNEKGIYLYGSPGTGKTYAICYLLNRLAAEGKLVKPDRGYIIREGLSKRCFAPVNVHFVNTADWVQTCRTAFERKEDIAESDKAMTSEILALDDIGVESMTDFARERIYALINHRYDENLLTLITSNLNLKELAGRINQRTASRVAGMCIQVEMKGPDRRIEDI